MRARTIKPGIITNEDLCGLGPYAYILFTGLWMMADREGRLEDRPGRIKATVMPLWDEISAKDVDKLLDGLADVRLIRRYAVQRPDEPLTSPPCKFIVITNFLIHQRPHPRELPSVIPAEPCKRRQHRRSAAKSVTSAVQNRGVPRHDPGTTQAQPGGAPRHNPGNAQDTPSPSFPSLSSFPSLNPSSSTKESGGGGGVVEGGLGETKTPPPLTQNPKPKPPASEQTSSTAQQRRPAPEKTPVKVSVPDFSAYPPERVVAVRASLDELAKAIRFPLADDLILREILDASQGATPPEIHRALAQLCQRGKFARMHSWGFVPVILGGIFGTKRTYAASA